MALVARQGDFEKVPDFEVVLRHAGGVAEPPPRPWTRLRNDPRVEAFIGATLEELHERNQKVEEAKQIEIAVRKTAAWARPSRSTTISCAFSLVASAASASASFTAVSGAGATGALLPRFRCGARR